MKNKCFHGNPPIHQDTRTIRKQFLISSNRFVYNIKWDPFNFKCQAHFVRNQKRIREANEWFFWQK